MPNPNRVPTKIKKLFPSENEEKKPPKKRAKKQTSNDKLKTPDLCPTL
jgi:hypothetical protein